MLAYQDRLASGRALPSFHDVEFRNTAQNGEDGILLYIFSLAGMGDRRAVEICAGDGIECNAANLVLHHGWAALLVDGNEERIEHGRAFYARHPETFRTSSDSPRSERMAQPVQATTNIVPSQEPRGCQLRPTLANEWVTRDNAQNLIEAFQFADNLDLLSIDMDGNDFWILDSLTVRPRVVVCEYNNRIPAGETITIPYGEDFAAIGHLTHGEGFFGASLAAYQQLLGSRGYRLVGANRPNTNAFFLREDVLADVLPTVTEASCLASPWARTMCAEWWPHLQHKPWVDVGA